jgi:hypothetical protein
MVRVARSENYWRFRALFHPATPSCDDRDPLTAQSLVRSGSPGSTQKASSHGYGQYVRDADNAGRQDSAGFFREVREEDSARAKQCHEFRRPAGRDDGTRPRLSPRRDTMRSRPLFVRRPAG